MRRTADPKLLLMCVTAFGLGGAIALNLHSLPPMGSFVTAAPVASVTSADTQTKPAESTDAQFSRVYRGQAYVIDGDTIEVQGRRIRFSGIDAPETRQECTSEGQLYACGERATAALKDLIADRTVECRQRGEDRYGRALADCTVGGQDVEAWMVSHGWAMAYRRYSTAYVAQEDDARAARRGIWSGDFEAPWDWRHAH